MRKIEVVDYNPKWKELFAVESNILKNILGEVAVAIHHIGSTAVQSLAAKPIIDILIEVTNLDALDALHLELETIGYIPKGEFGMSGRRYFQKGSDDRTHHIHAFAVDDPNIKRHIAFRNYLRSNKNVADEYGKLKKKIAKTCDNNITKYCDAKDEFVKKYEFLALK